MQPHTYGLPALPAQRESAPSIINTTYENTNGAIHSPALSSNAAAFIEQYLSQADISARSKETYRRALKQFFGWYETHNIQGIDRVHILAYKSHLLATKRATTASNYLSAVKGLFAWLEAEKLHPNVTAGVKGARASHGFRKEPLTVSQVGSVLGVLKGGDELALRDYALFNLLVRTGLRTIEVHRANIEDIRNKNGQSVLYVQGKGRDHKDAFVVLTEATSRPLYAYLKERKERNTTAPLFASLSNKSKGGRLSTRAIREIVKEAMREAGYDDERLSAHSLRHTAITLSLLGGATIQQAQAMARHSNINTTMIYSHNLDRVENAPEHLIDEVLGRG